MRPAGVEARSALVTRIVSAALLVAAVMGLAIVAIEGVPWARGPGSMSMLGW